MKICTYQVDKLAQLQSHMIDSTQKILRQESATEKVKTPSTGCESAVEENILKKLIEFNLDDWKRCIESNKFNSSKLLYTLIEAVKAVLSKREQPTSEIIGCVMYYFWFLILV